mmetsp:Transcript_18861/g.75234  ORF Transcript_18861/g.75234 Transcript_18861/m.75234 type:complete len:241 (-) Transcript_18861:742-1464(-)
MMCMFLRVETMVRHFSEKAPPDQDRRRAKGSFSPPSNGDCGGIKSPSRNKYTYRVVSAKRARRSPPLVQVGELEEMGDEFFLGLGELGFVELALLVQPLELGDARVDGGARELDLAHPLGLVLRDEAVVAVSLDFGEARLLRRRLGLAGRRGALSGRRLLRRARLEMLVAGRTTRRGLRGRRRLDRRGRRRLGFSRSRRTPGRHFGFGALASCVIVRLSGPLASGSFALFGPLLARRPRL